MELENRVAFLQLIEVDTRLDVVDTVEIQTVVGTVDSDTLFLGDHDHRYKEVDCSCQKLFLLQIWSAKQQ